MNGAAAKALPAKVKITSAMRFVLTINRSTRDSCKSPLELKDFGMVASPGIEPGCAV
jgi:hypothetical protein